MLNTCMLSTMYLRVFYPLKTFYSHYYNLDGDYYKNHFTEQKLQPTELKKKVMGNPEQ